MGAEGHPAGTASGQVFDLATAVRGGPERWSAEVDPGWTVAGRPNGPAGLPPVERCVAARPGLPGGMRANLLDHLDLRLDPATVGWAAGRPGGRLEMRGWVRFSDGRAADPL